MSAREWTVAKVSAAWAISDRHARHELNVALFLDEHLPTVWKLCQRGALDRARALTIVDTLRHRLDDPADWKQCAQRVNTYLLKHLRTDETTGVELRGVHDHPAAQQAQLRNQGPAPDRRLRDRPRRTPYVTAAEFDDGMGQLAITATVDEVRLARHRLHLCREGGPQGRGPSGPSSS